MGFYSTSQFVKDVEDGKNILRSCGLNAIDEVKIHPVFSERYTRYLGRATRKGVMTFDLILNHPFANMSSHDEIMNTIVHELLHMLPNCLNHGVVWKSYASIVYRKTGINIQTKHPVDNIETYWNARKSTKNTHTYQVECTQCHRRLGRKFYRRSGVIGCITNNPYQQNYCCPYCKTTKLIVKTDC